MLDSLRGLDETIQYGQGEKRKEQMSERSKELVSVQENLSRMEGSQRSATNMVILLASFGMLALLAYEIIAQQVAWVHNGANDAFHLFASPVDAAMYAWLFIVMLICAVLQTRKGYVDTNRFGQTDHLPAGYFLLIAGITGAASALAIAAMRCIAEAQIVPLENVFWVANLATGAVFGVVIFIAVFGALGVLLIAGGVFVLTKKKKHDEA